jgi:hypothetical protein
MCPLARAFGARFAVGHPARKTTGFVTAAISGTRLIPEECAPRVSISGLQRNASHAPDGRRIPTGMRTDPVNLRAR